MFVFDTKYYKQINIVTLGFTLGQILFLPSLEIMIEAMSYTI